jgi:hypothetical protein
MGPPRPGPLLNRPRGDKCSQRGKPSQANCGPKNRGRPEARAVKGRTTIPCFNVANFLLAVASIPGILRPHRQHGSAGRPCHHVSAALEATVVDDADGTDEGKSPRKVIRIMRLPSWPSRPSRWKVDLDAERSEECLRPAQSGRGFYPLAVRYWTDDDLLSVLLSR